MCRPVQVDRPGSTARDQTGGRRQGHLSERAWQPQPTPQLLAGNPRKGLGDPQGTTGRCKEGVVNLITKHSVTTTTKKKKQWQCIFASELMWLCHISGTETEGQGVWASLTGPESAGAGAGGADGQFVRGQHWSYDMSLRICLWGKLCWIAQTIDKIYSSRNCHWLAVLYRQLESTQLDVVKGSSLQIFANKSKSCWHRKKIIGFQSIVMYNLFSPNTRLKMIQTSQEI